MVPHVYTQVVTDCRHENTYRNMSDLSHDVEYKMMWKSNSDITEDSEAHMLLTPTLAASLQVTASSDSGHCSGNDSVSPHAHHRSQSDPQATYELSPYDSPSSPKKGFIHSYLEEHKKRRSMVANVTGTSTVFDNGFLVKAPEQFRSPSTSRPASLTESTHSSYAVSNTSDYGSNTVPSETNYSSRNNGRQLTNSLSHKADNSSGSTPNNCLTKQPSNVIIINSTYSNSSTTSDTLSESATKRPFTTFHGDVV